jgi:hypothetical protein
MRHGSAELCVSLLLIWLELDGWPTRIDGALCCFRSVRDGLFPCALDVCDMRLLWQRGLEADAARIGATALSGNGPTKLILPDYHGVEYQ